MNARVAIVPSAPNTDAADGILEGLRPLVKPGTYAAAFESWETALMFGGRCAKVALTFVLLDACTGTRLQKFYNVRRLIGKPRKRGRFVVGASSDLARDFIALTHEKARLDRLALSRLLSRAYRVTVRTVETGANQKPLPESLRYSVISAVESE